MFELEMELAEAKKNIKRLKLELEKMRIKALPICDIEKIKSEPCSKCKYWGTAGKGNVRECFINGDLIGANGHCSEWEGCKC